MSAAVLERATFETSRLLEYFNEKELTAQIGLSPGYWPVASREEGRMTADTETKVCPHCHGRGEATYTHNTYYDYEETCHVCAGSGRVPLSPTRQPKDGTTHGS